MIITASFTCARCAKPATRTLTEESGEPTWCGPCDEATDYCDRCEAMTEWTDEMCQMCGNVWGEPWDEARERYVVVLGSRVAPAMAETVTELVAPTMATALTLAASWMGASVRTLRRRHPSLELRWDTTMDTAVLTGYTIEKYDDVNGTDSDVCINGGLHLDLIPA